MYPHVKRNKVLTKSKYDTWTVANREKHVKELINPDVTKISSVYLDGSSIPNFKKCAVKNE
jgi:hypothetical protein